MINSFFDNKIAVVTGGTGSFGKTILRRLLKTNIKEIRVFSRDEQKHVSLMRQITDKRVKYIIGDVRDYDSVEKCFKGADIVFNAAAIKHVPIAEIHPWEATRTNVIGAKNCLLAADKVGVKRFISISTDKAVEPINAMGITKALQEKLVLAYEPDSDMICGCIRYGNVLNSNGSVVPFFKNLLDSGERVLPLTSNKMTRFILTLEQAIDLVFYSISKMNNGDLFVSDIPSLCIEDLADVMLESYGGGSTKIVGIRPGEKLHETLLSFDETARAKYEYSKDLGQHFYRVPKHGINENTRVELRSDKCYMLDKKEIKKLLIDNGIL